MNINWKWKLGDLVVPQTMLEETRRITKACGEVPYFTPGRIIIRMYCESALDEGGYQVEYEYRIRLGKEYRDYLQHELVPAQEMFDLWIELVQQKLQAAQRGQA